MAFDLRAALLKKAEIESARLADFDFRLRARTMRLLAARLEHDPAALVARIAHDDDAAIIAGMARESGVPVDAMARTYEACAAAARVALIAERGDPAPHRLA